jgi:hypothetical protein
MAKIPVKDWSGGINDKFSGNRISENQSKDSTDVELTNFRLSSSKGVDTTQTASGDYKFRGKWETDANAEKFLEYGDTLAKTYEANKVPAFVRKRGDTGNLTAEQSIGVPDKPSNAPTATIQTAGQTGSQPAVASFTVETEFGNSSSVADADTGGLADIGSDLNAPNQFYNTANDRLVTFDGTDLKVYDVSSNQLAQLPTSNPATHTPTYKDKWWFQDGYWVGVNATGISVLKFSGSGDPTLTQATHGTQTFTSAIFAESQVNSSTNVSASWRDGWVDSSNVTSGMSSLYPTDTYSVTSSSNKVFVSRVRKGKWWTINAMRKGDNNLHALVTNGYDSDSQGSGRFHLIIRDQGSTLTLNERTEGSSFTYWFTTYHRRFPRLASLTTGGLTYELYDFHTPSGFSYNFSYGGVVSTSSSRFNGYFTDTHTSTDNVIIGPYYGGTSTVSMNFGTYAIWECTGNTLVCLPIHDRISGSNFVDSYSLSDNGSSVSVKRSISGGGTDHIVYWNKSDGNFGYISPNDVGWSGEDTTNVFGNPSVGPGFYRISGNHDGAGNYTWESNISPVAISANNSELIHNFGSVFPIECTELTSYTLDGVTKTTSYHNNDSTVEPDYYVGSNTSRLWNWRKNNRKLYFDTHVKGGLSTNYLSHLLKDSHTGTSGYINVTPEGSVTKTNYDSGSETYHANLTTDNTLATASSGYQTTNKIAFFNGVLGYVFVSLDSSVGWGSGNYKYKIAGSNFDVSSGWTTKNLGHSHSETRTSGTTILFFNPNLDVLIPASGSLTNKSSYNISSNVVKANLLDSNKIVYRASNENVMKVVNTGASNANAVYALPFSDVIKYSSEFFYGIEYDYGSDARWENYRKCYVFYESEFSGSAIKNVTSGSGDTGSVTNVYSDSQNTTNRKKYILFSVTSAYNWRSQNLYIHISSTRIPKIVATEQQVYTDADCVATTVSSRVITLDNQAQALTTQVGDKFVLKKAGVEKYTGYVNSKSTSTTKQITLTTDDTIDGSVSNGDACTFTATRFVSKNRAWFDNSDYNKITVVTDEDFATQYSSTPERIAFDELASTDFLAVVKSSQSINVAGTHFYSDFDKHVDDSSALNLGSSTFTIGASDLNVTGGTPYSYIISYLRDIAESNENDADGNPVELLIEGPSTDESNEITISSASNHISVAGFGSSVPSGVTKIRVYRSGGNFTTYQHIVDLDVSGGIPAKYDDISKNILSTGFTPLPDRAKPKSDFRYIANCL